MNTIIVTTNTPEQEEYWHKALKKLQEAHLDPHAAIITVCEPPGRRLGNGLGAFWALAKAQEKAKFKYHIDLFERLRQGGSVSIYLASGPGKRIFPLAASERNDKAAIKLPLHAGGRHLTLLETAILQTQRAPLFQEGRLSVFWADQLIVSGTRSLASRHPHIEVLYKNGQSLGSFSLSAQMTFALLRELEADISEPSRPLDSQKDFWDPLALSRNAYLSQNEFTEGAAANYDRLAKFKERFLQLHPGADIYGVSDIGESGFWWHFGTTKQYYENLIKCLSQGAEGQALRLLFRLDTATASAHANRVIKDDTSCLAHCNIRGGTIKNSLLIGVRANSVNLSNCVVIGSSFNNLEAKNGLFYNVHEKENVRFSEGTVRADLPGSLDEGPLKIYSHLDRCSKRDWNLALPQNDDSFAHIFQRIQSRQTPLV